MDRFLFLVYIILLPSDSTRYLNFDVGMMKVSGADIVLAALLYIVLIKRLLSEDARVRFKYMGLFLAAIGCSLINFAYIDGTNILFDVKITLNLIEYCCLFYVCLSVVRDLACLRLVVTTYLATSVFLCILTIIMSLGVDMPGYYRRVFTHAGPFLIGVIAIVESMLSYSLMCLGTLPIILKNLIIDRRWLNICLGGLVVFSTVISYSRSLWVAVAFQIFLFMSLEYYEQKKIESRMLVFGIALVCLFTGSIYYSDIFNYAYEIRPSTFEGRWYGFKSGLESVTGSVVTLLFGVGKGQFVDEMYSRLGRGLVVHNFVLDLLVSKGLIALIFVMSIVFWILRDLVEILRSPGIRRGAIKDYAGFLLIGIGGMLMEGMFDPITNSIYLWTFLALASAFIAIARKEGTF